MAVIKQYVYFMCFFAFFFLPLRWSGRKWKLNFLNAVNYISQLTKRWDFSNLVDKSYAIVENINAAHKIVV